MSELPLTIKRSIRRYEPIQTDGLTLYPVLVKEYELFLMARPALEVMQQSLPVALMRVPLLSALYQMDYEAALERKAPTGLFSRALLILALSLRLGEGQDAAERIGQFRLAADPKEPTTLLRLIFTDADGNEKEIRPVQYQTLRQIIAAQNGVTLESDLANPDIVKAKKNLSGANAVPLNATVDDMIAGVSALSGAEEAEIEEWPILKLDTRMTAYRRLIDYIICGIGEVNGTTWKGGNPTPHPFFARADNGAGLFSVIGENNNGKAEAPTAAKELLIRSQNL